jgi:Fe-S cluster biogenesis protein NfuA
MQLLLILCTLFSASVSGFTTVPPGRSGSGVATITNSNTQLAEVISPFGGPDEITNASTTTKEKLPLEGPLELTWDNVEAVLDEMRHFLIQDGGNVAIQEIDGPVVRLELQGACGTCPSSTQTMKMGLGECIDVIKTALIDASSIESAFNRTLFVFYDRNSFGWQYVESNEF